MNIDKSNKYESNNDFTSGETKAPTYPLPALKGLIDKLYQQRELSAIEIVTLLENRTEELDAYLFEKSAALSRAHFGSNIYTRGLIEISSYCKNDCNYCGIRRSNTDAARYRLTKQEILSCCESGYALGFRTFVLQGGEDAAFTDAVMTDIVASIRKGYPDCAITLSLGEKSYDSYRMLYEAGADRYLLRHETANEAHYGMLHPKELSLANRQKCLSDLKQIGYQVGAGFMVGAPFQTYENLAEDLAYMKELSPQMVGIGPFIPHHQTPFAALPAGSLPLTLFLIGMLRLMLPTALIPATTAVGTLDPKGREKAILAGANVLMPNLSPIAVRKKYELYDNKICTGEEAAECKSCLANRVASIGYRLAEQRGDFPGFPVRE